MPTLDWIGKKAVVNHHNEVPYKTLELQYTYKEGKKNFDCGESENMIIHGDNLEAEKKILLGNLWATRAGSKFKYCLVYKDRKVDGAYTKDEFLELMKEW